MQLYLNILIKKNALYYLFHFCYISIRFLNISNFIYMYISPSYIVYKRVNKLYINNVSDFYSDIQLQISYT